MAKHWNGRKRLAFVPVYRPHAAPPDVIPPNWADLILGRAMYDPHPQTGVDRSLRAYIHTVSSGTADLYAEVMPMVEFDAQDVHPDDLEAQLGPALRAQHFDGAAIVMLGGQGAGSSTGYCARFVMAEDVGVWAMEFLHVLTGFKDLYKLSGYDDYPNGDMEVFDEMAASRGTHPSAYTKAALGWLNPWAIQPHTGRSHFYRLHPVGMIQPPPEDRRTAIRIGTDMPYLMIEARQNVGEFDFRILNRGVFGVPPPDGVIVYRIQTSDPDAAAQNNRIPLYLLTPRPLAPGESLVTDTNMAVSVIAPLTAGGYSIVVDDRNASFEAGQLLFYRDNTRDGTGDISTPGVIGQGGWQEMLFVFGGDPGILYAVNRHGQLLFYRDHNRDGTADVNSPSVIGHGGWQVMRQLTNGGAGILYATVS